MVENDYADELSAGALGSGMKFSPLALDTGDEIRAVFGLARAASLESTPRWYGFISQDGAESYAMAWATLASVFESRMNDTLDCHRESVTGDETTALCVLAAGKDGVVSFQYGSSSGLAQLGVARSLQEYVRRMLQKEVESTMNNDDLVDLDEVVGNIELLLGPTYTKPMPTDVDYLIAVVSFENEEGQSGWSYRTSGPVNSLELLGALDVEIERLRRLHVVMED